MRIRTAGHIGVAMVFLVLCMIFVSACAVQPVTMPIAEPAVELDEDALTRAYAEEAIAYFEEHGLEKTIEFYSSEESVDGERYLMLLDPETTIVHAAPIAFLVGAKLPMFQPGGQYAGQAERATAAGHWAEGLGINPVSGKTEPQRLFIVLRHNLLFLSGHFILRENVEAITKEYVAKAIARYQNEGLEAVIAHYNSRASMDGQFYLFMTDENDIYLVHPIFPHLIGTDIKDIVGSDGQELGKEIAQASEEGHWIEYLWPNPLTSLEESKVTWAVRYDGKIFASGYYTGSEEAVEPAWVGADPREYTLAYVHRAIERYDRDGLDSLKAYYNSVASFESQWYLFVMDANDIYIIHPFLPRLIGTDIKNVVGSDGFELGKEFAKATEAGHWIEYLWPHPITLKEVPKVGYAVRHDGMIFASGYYPAPSVAELRVATVEYVRQAVEYYKENGLDATVEHYNSRESISDNDIYLRLLDANNIVIVQPLQPQLIGKDYVAVAKTPQGVRVGELVVAAATEEGGWVQFEAQLPNTRASGFSQRYLLAVRHDNLIFVASFSASE